MAGKTNPTESPHTRARRLPDLREIPNVPWAWVDERIYARIRGCSVQLIRRERQLGRGCPYRKINGTMIRYRLREIHEFLEQQPGGPLGKRGTAPTLDSLSEGFE